MGNSDTYTNTGGTYDLTKLSSPEFTVDGTTYKGGYVEALQQAMTDKIASNRTAYNSVSSIADPGTISLAKNSSGQTPLTGVTADYFNGLINPISAYSTAYEERISTELEMIVYNAQAGSGIITKDAIAYKLGYITDSTSSGTYLTSLYDGLNADKQTVIDKIWNRLIKVGVISTDLDGTGQYDFYENDNWEDFQRYVESSNYTDLGLSDNYASNSV